MALIPLLGGCATSREFESTEPAPALPTVEEVRRYVTSGWPERNKTFARLAERPGEIAELIDVPEVACSYNYTTPECWYRVTARFGDEPNVQQRLFSQFERDDAGNLFEVIVMWHRRRR